MSFPGRTGSKGNKGCCLESWIRELCTKFLGHTGSASWFCRWAQPLVGINTWAWLWGGSWSTKSQELIAVNPVLVPLFCHHLISYRLSLNYLWGKTWVGLLGTTYPQGLVRWMLILVSLFLPGRLQRASPCAVLCRSREGKYCQSLFLPRSFLVSVV